MRKLSPTFLLVFFLILGEGAFHDSAEGRERVDLYDLQPGSFPSMSATLDVFDESGNFVTGMTPDSVSLFEDGRQRPLDSLQELQQGAQFVIAFNPGPAFANRDANGVSRCDKILAALYEWATARAVRLPDDVSLVTTDGLVALHMTEVQVVLDTLTAYQPQARSITPSLGTLSQALDIVAGPSVHSGAKRAILFVTSLLDADTLATLESLAARAIELDIHVYVWMVGPADYFSTSGATALNDLTIQTGGQAFAFSGTEDIPDLETYLVPLRHTYALGYTSHLNTPGNHTLEVKVNLGEQTISSPPLVFELDVQPPNPILVSLPGQIVRQSPAAETANEQALTPTEHPIAIIVEFPDNHPRPLVRTTLYVDGKITAVNTATPFDQFTWDLSGYNSSSQHNLQVEAVDSLGLSKVSMGVPVVVTVIEPQRGLMVFLARNNLWVTGGAVLVAGIALTFILIAGGRRRAAIVARRMGRKSRLDPVTQPIIASAEKAGRQLPWLHRGKPAPAHLIRLKGNGEPVTAPPIPLSGSEMTFGTNPTQATQVLDDPSVSPLHAIMRRERDGEFYLQDAHSTAGTWVNYEMLLDKPPRHLQHGDIIHFGQLSYRFMLRKPPGKPKPRIVSQ